jgi:signal transduction histidine kinase
MEKEVRRLTSLVRSLLEVTRAEGDPASRRAHVVDLQQVVRDVVEDCAVEAEARQCGLVTTSSTSRQVIGDGALLNRAIENVVRNAIRYTPHGSTVDITLMDCDDDVRLTIRDYGPGVPEDLLPRLAAPFFRVEEARDYSPEGSVGLGLSIAKRAIDVHGGSLTAENANPGLRVTIRIPVRGAPARVESVPGR